jgi:hypothetical protein
MEHKNAPAGPVHFMLLQPLLLFFHLHSHQNLYWSLTFTMFITNSLADFHLYFTAIVLGVMNIALWNNKEIEVLIRKSDLNIGQFFLRTSGSKTKSDALTDICSNAAKNEYNLLKVKGRHTRLENSPREAGEMTFKNIKLCRNCFVRVFLTIKRVKC